MLTFLFTDGDQQNNAILRGSNFIQSQCDINFTHSCLYIWVGKDQAFYCRKFIHFSQKLCNKFFKLLVFKLVLLSLELMGFHCVPLGFLIFFCKHLTIMTFNCSPSLCFSLKCEGINHCTVEFMVLINNISLRFAWGYCLCLSQFDVMMLPCLLLWCAHILMCLLYEYLVFQRTFQRHW